MPVVKANAYGHGIVEVAQAVAREGAACFGVALAEEGVALRESGIAGEILVFGSAMERAAEAALGHGLTQTVFRPDQVCFLEETAKRLGKVALAHIKLDTGMGRIGLSTPEEAQALKNALDKARHVKVTGIYTHFSDADHPEGDGEMNGYTRMQLERFLLLKSHFDPSIPAHAANSAQTLVGLSQKETLFSRVREGISLYGYPPVRTSLPFRRALRLESEVTHVKTVPAGSELSYGRTFATQRETRVATVAIGYGDGYHRAGSNRAWMLVCGRRAPVVGRICMDQTLIDVTDIPGAAVGSPVVVLGSQGAEEITAEELAAWAGTISYEVLLAITDRVPREYIGGE